MHPLPIDALERRFVSLCRPGARVVVSAPTGSGKSTRLPWWMADGLRGRILVVEPRRVAARALATYGAKLRGESVGARVGYRVRFDAAESEDTEILFVTPGMALALLADDGPSFAGVLVDEFHERGWETDLVTALVQSGHMGPDAALVVCSATLARDALCEVLQAEPLSGQGRAFDVSLQWDGQGGPSLDGLAERVRAATRRAFEHDGDVLVFLPGKREIGACRTALSDFREADVLPLHGGLSAAEMQRALGPADRRRVFLATNVAETSLTIPSVTTVIDSGLERRHVHRGGKVVLSVVPISLASAEQRRGRAGRVRAGTCTRLWSQAFELAAATPPQIERIDLDDVLLRAGMCGVPPAEASKLPWVTAPPSFAVDAALARLRASGAIGDDGRLTDTGRLQAKLPVSWVGARVLTNPPRELASALCDVVAVMEIGRELLDASCSERQSEARADLFHGAGDEVDVALRCVRDGDARVHALRPRTLEECRRLARSLSRAIGAPATIEAPEPRALARCIAAAVPELVFVRRARADRARDKPSRGGEPWGNGDVEVFLHPYRVPSLDRQPKPPVAGVVLEREWLGVGQRARGVGRLLMRLELVDLAALHLGEATAGEIRVVKGRVVAEVTRTLAGITLSRGVEEVTGDALRDALVALVLRGTLMKGLAASLLDALHGWSVLAAWGRREGHVLPDPPPDAAAYLRSRFESLGVEGLEDLQLLEHDDVLPAATELAVEAGMDPRLAVALPSDLPRTLELPGGRYACSVDVPTRTVELLPVGGTKKEPAAGLLPRFRGFSVVFVKASRRLRLR